MRIDSAIITGSFSVNGDTFNDLGVFPSTGSNTFVGNQSIVGAVSASALTGSISYTNLTNVPTLVSGSEQIVSILSPLNSFTSSTTTKINSLEEKTGSLASTGSNTFIGTQTITGSLYISSDLIVQGSSSLQNITASAVSIGTNIVNLNTANPAIRYAGLVIGDSGSVGSSGSFLYDSVQDEFIFVHRGTNTTVTSSVLLMGPQTYDSIGNETYLTTNRIPKGAGNEHLADSNISDNGVLVSVTSPTSYFSGSVGIGTTNPGEKLTINGSIGIQRSGTQIWHTSVDSSNNLQFTRSGIAERMTISSDGLVGIGTTAPSASLHIVSNTPYIYLDDASTSGTKKRFQLLVGDVGSTQTTTLGFNNTSGTSLTEVMALNENGRVGIGMNDPQASLHIIRALGSDVISIGESGTNTRLTLGQESSYAGNYIDSRNIDLKFKSYLAGGTGGNIIFQTGDGSVSSRFRINTNGTAQVVGVGNQLTFDTLNSSNSVTMGALGDYEFRIRNARGTSSDLVLGNTNIDLNTANTLRLRINDTGAGTYTGPFSFSSSITTSGYHYSQGSTVLRKTLNITEGVTTTLLSFDQAGSYGHTGGGEILVVFVDPGSPWGVYVWKGLLTIRTVQFTGAYYGSNLSVIATNSTIDGSFDISATFSKTNGLANGEVRVRVVPGSGIGGTAYVYWNGLVTQGGNAY
jgi:hypothetical protein